MMAGEAEGWYMSQVIVITSGKGGVGKTTATANHWSGACPNEL